MDDRQPVSLARRALSYAICYLIAVQPMLPAAAAVITPVTPGTKMDAAGNGVPVINIATPSQAGISHNQYQQYNVGKEGLILNNATGQLNQTQLGGLIQNNPNLKAGHEAKAIINEVTGATRSQLQGYTEVAGKAANVMVANPYGITCNGCGFINTPNATLTTGKPTMDAQGNLQSLAVSKGTITIEGQGLDASQSDALSIISRASEINAAIHAKDLKLIAGTNRVMPDGSVTPIAGEGAAPGVAVDTGALGGMYANRIHLVSSEKGVGVNLGNLNARQGDMVLDASGRLTLKNSLTSGALTAKGDSLVLAGDHKASGPVTLTGQKDITLSAGAVVSDNSIILSGNNTVTLSGGKLTAGKDIRLSATDIKSDRASTADSGGDIGLTVRNGVDNGAQITAGGMLSLSAKQVKNSGALLAKGQQTVIATDSLENSGQLQGDEALELAAGRLINSGQAQTKRTLTLTADETENSGTLAADSLIAKGKKLANSGEVEVKHTLSLTADETENSGRLVADSLIIKGKKLANSGAVQGTQTLDITADELSNDGSMKGDILLVQGKTLTNRKEIFGGKRSEITADRLTQSGTLSAQGTTQLTLAETLTNSGAIAADDALAITSLSLFNTGSLSAPRLQLSSAQLTNSGLIQGSNGLAIAADRLDNLSGGSIDSHTGFTLDLPALYNAGLIKSDAGLTLAGDTLVNSGELSAATLTASHNSLLNAKGGQLLAQDAMQVRQKTLTNQGVLSADDLTVDAGDLKNNGTLQGSQRLNMTGNSLSNSGTLLSAGALALQGDNLDNQGLIQGEKLTVTTSDWQNSGNALSASDADLRSKTLHNSGKILGQRGIQIQAESTDNGGWMMAQALTLQSDLINSGLLQGDDRVVVNGDTISNHSDGQLLSTGTLDVTAAQLDNQGTLQADRVNVNAGEWQNSGSSRAASLLAAQVTGIINNAGSLTGEQLLDLQGSQILNQGSLVADRLSLTAPLLSNGGLMQGNSALTLNSTQLVNQKNGELLSGGPLSLTLDRLDNAGLLQVDGALEVTARQLSNDGRMLADTLSAQADNSLINRGELLARQQATLNAQTLENSGVIAAHSIGVTADTLSNRGAMQGDTRVEVAAQQLDNQSDGTMLSGERLTLRGDSISNSGGLQSQQIDITGNGLVNRGLINSTGQLTASLRDKLDNSGSLLSQAESKLTANHLLNSGKIMADGLTLRGQRLESSGLWQGNSLLDARSDTLDTAAGSRTLSGGLLRLDADQLTTGGTLQGGQAQVTAGSWQHQGSLLGTGGLEASVAGQLINDGELLSQGAAQIGAQRLVNIGDLLSAGVMTLTGSTLDNSGSVQGQTLTISPAKVINQGSLIGLQALTLGALPQTAGRMMLMAMAVPARELTNNKGGALLTQGTLIINGDAVTNNGSWQGQQILLNARRLNNGGEIQSADGMQLILADKLDSTAGSKISANGAAALQALALTNQGQWIARNLTLNGNTLNNGGDISGVDGLTITLNGALTQQQNKTLLTAGKLDLQAASVNNAGRIQGGELNVTSGALENSGALQGDKNLLLTLNGRLTNAASGTLIGQNGLTLTTPELYNYGLIQGGGTTGVSATTLANNAGKILSGGELTLETPQLINSGWLQATQLMLTAASASNSGTLLAQQQATLTGNGFTNQGSAQGGNLRVNYQQLNNSGILLGNNQLDVTATQVNQQAAGKLFSGGSMELSSNGFDQLGQVVALGDATLKLINGFTNKGTLAAGKRLSVTSNGALENQGTLQGQALTLGADGNLVNKGQLTSGSGDSTLSGSRIAMNASGTLQGGGNINLTSRSDITLDGFTGTLGNLTLSAPGSIVNTALLYAANNLYLYANSIKNQQGDMLAGNSLWMQRDAAGNANTEVVNSSGTIETQKGDITVKTGHLLNTRDGLNVEQSTTKNNSIDGLGNASIDLLFSQMPDGTWGYYSKTGTHQTGPCNGHGACSYTKVTSYYYAPLADYVTQKFSTSKTKVDVVAKGGAARISAGRNLTLYAKMLDNQASNILASQNVSLSGAQLNNQSWQAGVNNDYLVYEYAIKNSDFHPQVATTDAAIIVPTKPKVDTIYFKLTGHETDFTPGQLYRAVIQAGGNVSASFSGDISNTNTTANAGWDGNTLAAPDLNRFSVPGSVAAVQQQQLAAAGNVAVNSPQWRDQLQNALQQVNGAASLDDVPTTGVSLADHDIKAIDDAKPGKAVELKATGDNGGQTLNPYQLSHVDVSAYPLPSGSNGYFVASTDSKSPYLINLNPKLNGLGKLDQNLFGDLNALLGKRPGSSPQENRKQYTDENAFLGSSYLLERLNLKPEYDYRLLGDAAFDTRYVSNTVLNQTGSRYLNGLGSELDQMRYLMDNAAAGQQALGLQFGVSLSAEQVASLDKSIIWWEASTVNGETVMVPKVYLSQKDVTLQNGSVIAGNNVSLKAGNITNSGSTVAAQNDLKLDSGNQFSNLSAGLIHAGGNLQLSALGDINNVGSTISGKTVALESVNGDISNITTTQQWTLDARNNWGQHKFFTETLIGPAASIAAFDSLSLKAGNDISVTGAKLSAGGDMRMTAWNDIAITGNQIETGNAQSGFKYGWQNIDATSDSSLSSQGSQLNAGGNLAVQAGHNLDVTASAVKAGGDAQLAAGNDINLNAAATQQNSRSGNYESHSSGVDRTTISSGGDLQLVAGRDLNSQAAGIAAESDVALQAGRDLNLQAEATRSGNSYKAGKKQEINEHVRQQGTEVVSGGGTMLMAGNDITSNTGTIIANKDLALQAGHDVNITTATESDYAYREETKTKKSLFSKKTTHTIKEDSSTTEKASQLSGDHVSIVAGHDLAVKGSSVVGESDVGLKAGNDLTIGAATETQNSYRLSETKKSGMFSGGGIGVTFGSASSRQQINLDGTTQSQSASAVGSTGGNVALIAGHDARVAGSDVIAKQDISLVGGSVSIDPGNDMLSRRQVYEQKQSGLTLQLTSPITDALLSLGAQAKEAGQAGDDRLKALSAVKMLESGWAMAGAASQSATALAKGDMNNAGIKIALSVGASKSKSSSEYTANTVSGSSLSGGGNVAVVATGANGTRGDINVAGSGITGKNVTLAAEHNLNLVAASNNQQQTSSNTSSGWSGGIHFSIGKETGIGIQASGFMASGNEDGTSTDYVNSRINAKDTLTLSSGNDTLLSGAQALGNRINTDTGHDLTLTSLQDTDSYHSKQQSASGGFSFTFGSMTGSIGLSLSQSKVNSEYASVGEQSGLFAGADGYDVYVGNHTQLNGAVIASTADAAHNAISTSTLGWDNISNHAEYSASSSSIGFSAGNTGGEMSGMVLPTSVNAHGNASGVTKSAVSDGSVTVRDSENQIQNVSDLSRDTESANGHIDKIFDKDKVARQMEFAQGVQQLAGQIVSDVTSYKLDEAKKATAEKLIKEHPEYADLPAKDFNELIESDGDYKAVSARWGTGGAYSMAAAAVSAALGGLSANDLGAAASGVMAPYVANTIKKATTTMVDGKEQTNLLANTMAHALAGAVLAQLADNNAVAGATGAMAGELTARAIVAAMYPGKNAGDLTESEKESVSALSQLAAGLASGIASDSSGGAISGAGAGKNAVENNALSDLTDALAAGKSPQQIARERNEETLEEIKKEQCAGLSAEACSVRLDAYRQKVVAGAVSLGVDFVPVVGSLKSVAEAEDALGYLEAVASVIPGERIAGKIFKAARAALKKGDVAEASKLINKASDEIEIVVRPGHRQSEIDVGKDLGEGWREQVTFKGGKEVPYGTKGSVRPDWCQGNICSVEVKNYNIEKNQSGLINNVSKQAVERQKNLPAGMRQEVVIDVRGQQITSAQEDAIIKGIVNKSNGAINPTDIQFKR
ncbi:hemagglutinin repeat-containing protein [Pantoea sp. FN060301]|uniref:hemagglutinin repeat-containing protein n=1 Tax=Pantoea sp. FN060301 TaxID=3420380 RepID=UPI003D16B831